jgi:hypothetical protein
MLFFGELKTRKLFIHLKFLAIHDVHLSLKSKNTIHKHITKKRELKSSHSPMSPLRNGWAFHQKHQLLHASMPPSFYQDSFLSFESTR